VFAVTLSVIVPLLDPLAGVTISHAGDITMSVDVVHEVFDVTVAVVLLAAAPGFQDEIDTVNVVGEACVTLIVLVIPPP